MGTRGAGRAQRCPLLDLHPYRTQQRFMLQRGPGSGAAGRLLDRWRGLRVAAAARLIWPDPDTARSIGHE